MLSSRRLSQTVVITIGAAELLVPACTGTDSARTTDVASNGAELSATTPVDDTATSTFERIPDILIVAFDGDDVTSAGDFLVALRQSDPGDDVVISVVRNGTELQITGQQPETQQPETQQPSPNNRR